MLGGDVFMKKELVNEIVEEYNAHDQRKLKSVVFQIIKQFGNAISSKDHHDFISLANEEVWLAAQEYDEAKGKTVDGWIYTCVEARLKTYMTRLRRKKRMPEGGAILSIEEILSEEGDLTILDTISGGKTVEEIVNDNLKIDSRVTDYLNSLSDLQRKIIELKVAGADKRILFKKLGITEKEYQRQMKELQSYDKVKILSMGNENVKRGRVDDMKTQPIVVAGEDRKTEAITFNLLRDDVNNYELRLDHPMQRYPGQWANFKKDAILITIILGYGIAELVIAEQERKGIKERWLIDGLQRFSVVDSYVENQWKISKNLSDEERPLIRYRVLLKDETGRPLLDENNEFTYEMREFDVRGCYFRDLPKELQDKILKYNFTITTYLNCSDADIQYHIRRLNNGKEMTSAQKGVTHLDKQYAKVIKQIIANSRFFKNTKAYQGAARLNGTVERVVAESVMAINFLPEWKKKYEDICTYLKENSQIMHYDKLEDYINRIDEVLTDDIRDLFVPRDTFLWFALFDKFAKIETDDEKFADFLRAFKADLHGKVVDDVSYDMLVRKSTKDKKPVTQRMELLETLMNEFLAVQPEETVDEFEIETNMNDYVEKFNAVSIVESMRIVPKAEQVRVALKSLMMSCGRFCLTDKEIQEFIIANENDVLVSESMEDVLLNLDCLTSWTLKVDNNSQIFDKDNVPALVSIVGHAYRREIDDALAQRWFERFVNNFRPNQTFKLGVDKFKVMKKDFDNFVEYSNNLTGHGTQMNIFA